MEITLPADLSVQVEEAILSGRYSSRDALIAEAIRALLDESERVRRRAEALRRIGDAVDAQGLYGRVVVPGQ